MSKRIVILGGAESGVGAAYLAAKKGFDVFLSDNSEIKNSYKKILIENNITFEEKKHTLDFILNADEVIKSPGIPDKIEVIKKIKEKNIPIISEIEFATRFTKAKMICITGSNGKTTTTLLTYEIFLNAGLNVGLAGNVGNSFAMQVADNDFDYYILELSSFQLDNMYEFKADTAVLLNITPDHLDRYNYDFSEYVKSKFRITQNQTDKDNFIFNFDDENIINTLNNFSNSKRLPFSILVDIEEGANLDGENIKIKTKNDYLEMLTSELSLMGKHNIYNSMAAALVAMVNNIKNPIIKKTLSSFKPVEHRLEKVLTVRNIHFINDSKATNVNSVWYALDSVKSRIVLIMGGQDKGNDYSVLQKIIKEKVKAIIALGIDNKSIIESFSHLVPITESNTMSDAVMKAYKLADKSETVLLSPACASFDLFENYIDRGLKFKEAVRNL